MCLNSSHTDQRAGEEKSKGSNRGGGEKEQGWEEGELGERRGGGICMRAE